MTCIVGLIDKTTDTVWMGGDSLASYEDDVSIEIRVEPKVFKSGNLLLGICGSSRMAQILRYLSPAPMPAIGQDIHEFMVTTFVEGVRIQQKEFGCAEVKDSVETMSGDILVGFHGRLFTVHSDYDVGHVAGDYAVVGCGRDLAMGSLFTTAKMKMAPKKRVLTALEAAEEWSAGVRRPFVIEKLPPIAEEG